MLDEDDVLKKVEFVLTSGVSALCARLGFSYVRVLNELKNLNETEKARKEVN